MENIPMGDDESMDEVLDLQQVAELLEVSEKTMLRLLAKEALPARKVGGRWKFSRNAIFAWLASGNSQSYSRTTDGDEDSGE